MPGARKHGAGALGRDSWWPGHHSAWLTINISQLRAFCRIALDATWQPAGGAAACTARAHKPVLGISMPLYLDCSEKLSQLRSKIIKTE